MVVERNHDSAAIRNAAHPGFVEIRNLGKRFDGLDAVDDVSLDVDKGRMVSLLGPSGCGKTTILRCIAGLETPSRGHIRIGDKVVNDVGQGIEVPPNHRSIGMVFQSYAVWPHMTVGENVAFPLKVGKTPRETVAERVAQTLERVGLGDFQSRPATALSGGQQQRVALARALIAEPDLVLFDEPLSNLDAKLREYMRAELQTLQARLGFTAIYVTHDQEEALAISDEIIILNQGRVEQCGEPREVYKSPETLFVADFMGASNVLDGRVVDKGAGQDIIVEFPALDLSIVCPAGATEFDAGQAVKLAFRPDACRLSTPDLAPPGAARLKGTVHSSIFLGSRYEVMVDSGGGMIRVNCGINERIVVGEPAVLELDIDKCKLIPDPSG